MKCQKYPQWNAKRSKFKKKKYHIQLDNWTFSFLFASFKERGARYALSQLPKVRIHQTNVEFFFLIQGQDDTTSYLLSSCPWIVVHD